MVKRAPQRVPSHQTWQSLLSVGPVSEEREAEAGCHNRVDGSRKSRPVRRTVV